MIVTIQGDASKGASPVLLSGESKPLELTRMNGENAQQYLWRIGSLKDAGVITDTWEQLAPVLNEQTGKTKSSTIWRKEFSTAKRYKENVFDAMMSGNAVTQAQLLKYQAQTKNLETNKWLREKARDDLIFEEIQKYVSELTPLDPPNYVHLAGKKDKVGVLCYGDEHFGTEYEIVGLDGKVINAYSPDIFYQRMWSVYYQTLDIIDANDLDELYVFNFGDFADGVLRVSQLMKLKYGVVESTVKYAEFICDWLTELSRHVHIHFQMTPGNHTELRLLGQPKGTFVNENMDMVVKAFIKARMKDNPNFDITENPTKMIYADIFGYKILGVHGEVGNTDAVVKDFSHTYGVKINYFMAGHKHHSRNNDVGINCEFIGIPSIIGVDSFSIDLNRTSNPAATLLLLEKDKGKTVQYFMNLSDIIS